MIDEHSSKAEVLAAVEDTERRLAMVDKKLRMQTIATIVRCGGRVEPGEPYGINALPQMIRQAAAGEEDQSVPGWDQGA